MIWALGRVLDGLERDLGPKAMVELPRHGIAAGASGLLRGHWPSSVCTSLKPYSAYTTSGDKAMDLIRLPRRFLDDHDERMCDNEEGIPLVERVRETARFAWVRRDDPGLADLRNDAEYYAASAVPGGLSEGYEWTGRAAKTLLRVLDEASAKKAETVACPYCEGTGRRLGSMLPCNDPNGCKGSGRLPPLGIPGGGR